MNISLFYKDITSQPGWVYYQNMNGTVQVNRIENNNYEDIRGLELKLKKNVGQFITGMINYTYLVQSSGPLQLDAIRQVNYGDNLVHSDPVPHFTYALTYANLPLDVTFFGLEGGWKHLNDDYDHYLNMFKYV